MKNHHWVLMNPGPVNVTEKVRQALLKPDICHREEEFYALLRQVREKLLKIFGIKRTHTVAVMTGSGTLAVEAMMASLQGEKVLVLSNGVYGDRLKDILKIHNIPHEVLSAKLGFFPDLAEVESILKKDKSITAVAMVHHETSTGMLNPIREAGLLAKKYKKIFAVDAVSSLGAETIDFKKWGIDLCAGSAGKCLHAYPGVCFVFVSNKLRQRLRDKKHTSLYMNLSMTLDAEDQNNPPFTPAVQLFYALDAALDELKAEGLTNRIKAYAHKSHLLEKGFAELGVHFVVEKKYRSHVLQSLWLPTGLSYEKLHDELKKKSFVIYAGQSALKNSIFRVANLGDINIVELRLFLNALKKILKK